MHNEKKSDKPISESILKKSEKHRRGVEALLKASRAVLKFQKFDLAAKAIFDVCKELTGATSGYVALLSDTGEENDVLFLDSGGRPCLVDPELPMPIRGLRSVSYAENRAVYDNDFMNSEWVQFMPSGHVVLDNVMFSPLVVEGRAIGLIGLANKEGGFDDYDAEMAAAFGELAAISLRNSRTLDALTESESKLRNLNAMKDKILSVISHDLKDPFQVIISISKILDTKYDKLDDDKKHYYINEIISASQASYQLFENLLDWSRSERNRFTLQPADFNLHELSERIMKSLSYAVKPKNINMVNDIPENFKVHSDEASLQIVLRNIISNAVKFTPDNGKIAITAAKDDGFVKITVTDSGIGMSDEVKDIIMSEADFISQPGTNNEKGTGLGLKLCRDLIKNNNGMIKIDSETGKGTAVKVILPDK